MKMILTNGNPTLVETIIKSNNWDRHWINKHAYKECLALYIQNKSIGWLNDSHYLKDGRIYNRNHVEVFDGKYKIITLEDYFNKSSQLSFDELEINKCYNVYQYNQLIGVFKRCFIRPDEFYCGVYLSGTYSSEGGCLAVTSCLKKYTFTEVTLSFHEKVS